MTPPEAREVWFLTGSQGMYGEETLRQVAEQSAGASPTRSAPTQGIPVEVVWKPVLTDADAIRRICLEAGAADRVHRSDRLDAHVLPGQDVDRRPRRAGEAVAAPAHAGQRRRCRGPASTWTS